MDKNSNKRIYRICSCCNNKENVKYKNNEDKYAKECGNYKKVDKI